RAMERASLAQPLRLGARVPGTWLMPTITAWAREPDHDGRDPAWARSAIKKQKTVFFTGHVIPDRGTGNPRSRTSEAGEELSPVSHLSPGFEPLGQRRP